MDRSWQGLSASDSTAASDASFNPLTYMLDRGAGAEEEEPRTHSRRESESSVEPPEEDLSSLSGMLRFVTQTLARQDDPAASRSAELAPV